MDGSIRLPTPDRKALLDVYRRGTDPDQRLRAHILLLLDDGVAWVVITAVLFTSTATINRWRRRYLAAGVAAVTGRRATRVREWWAALAIGWLTGPSPTAFRFARSRWTCETVAVLLWEDYRVRVSRETVRRRLREADLVWRRPRPVLGPKDPAYGRKLGRIRALPADAAAVFMDEVDVNTNPKIGSMWMERGRQAEVVTPGNNEKRYLAGSWDWRSRKLTLTEGRPWQGRDTDLFLAHLDDLRRTYRRYRVIHVVCDNAKPHHAKRVREYLAKHEGRVVLHYLPTYAPETNPIERVWWRLHEDVTRNHRCQSMGELLGLVRDWLATDDVFAIDCPVYADYARPRDYCRSSVELFSQNGPTSQPFRLWSSLRPKPAFTRALYFSRTAVHSTAFLVIVSFATSTSRPGSSRKARYRWVMGASLSSADSGASPTQGFTRGRVLDDDIRAEYRHADGVLLVRPRLWGPRAAAYHRRGGGTLPLDLSGYGYARN